ncbi:MAG: ABC transporter substrate-binding protein [Actinobacteria bacterium]|nr:ABC transporter substrate-binding protein [Actinomycetota bacterium]
MKRPRIRGTVGGALLAALAAIVAVLVAPAGAQETTTEDGGKAVLKIGWGQDPQTLNPFVGLDEENYTVWALNWDLLVNFDPEDLQPAPGIAESWEVSDDQQTVTFTLADRKWSDGTPITSRDVKYSLDVLGGEGTLFAGYTSNVESVTTPDDKTVVVKTKQPEARIVGGLFIYILPEHIWGKVPVSELTSSYQPEIPMVGSGPFIVTEFERNRILRMERNPEWSGEEPNFDEVQFIKYGNEDATERALQLGEVDIVAEVQPSTFERLGNEENIETVRGASPSYTELAFNLCSAEDCPDAEFNPAVQDKTVRQAIANVIARERINEISALGTSFVANGILPSFYKTFYETPELDYNPTDVEEAKRLLDEAGWQDNGDQPRTKGDQTLSFELQVRSESQSDIQASRLIAEMVKEIGVEFKVQVVSVDALTEATVRFVDGKPAPDFDTFVWGWGGDPYDPSFLLSLFTTEEIGNSSDSFYSNPEYDRLFREQAAAFDDEERKQIIGQMVDLTQEDLPYVVLTEDPNLQAYRTDRLSNVEQQCPADEGGDIFCEQISYEPMLTLALADGSSSDDDGGGGSGVLIAIGVLVVGAIVYFVIRSRRRGGGGPIELEE